MKKRLKRISAFFTIALLLQMMIPFGQVYAETTKAADGIYVETYISEIKVAGSGDKNEAKKALENEGFKVIDYDLNYGAGGDFIYLGYKTTTEYSEAIKDIRGEISYTWYNPNPEYFSTRKINANGVDYFMVDCLGSEGFIKSGGNLNNGVGGSGGTARPYLFYTKSELSDKKALTYLSVYADTPMMECATQTSFESGGLNLNRNCNPRSDLFLKATRSTAGTRVDPMNIKSSEWMKNIYDNVKITALNIPGCHDAGTYHTSIPDVVGDYFANCQKYPIGDNTYKDYHFNWEGLKTIEYGISEQGLLNMGYRYFDIRYAANLEYAKTGVGDPLEIVHSGVQCKYKVENDLLRIDHFEDLNNTKLMQWLKDFLNENPSETIILDCSVDEPDKNVAPGVKEKMIEFYKNLAQNPDPSKYPKIYVGNHVPTLGECRGKIVVLVEGASESDLKIGNKYWGFTNASGVGDKKKKTTDRIGIDETASKNLNYEVYKNNQWDGVFKEEKWEWVRNGLYDSESILKNSQKSGKDPFVMIYSSANNLGVAVDKLEGINWDNFKTIGISLFTFDWSIVLNNVNAINTALAEGIWAAQGTIPHYSDYINPAIISHMQGDLSNKFVGIIATDKGGEDLARAIWQSNFTRTLPRSGSVLGGGNIWIIIAIIGLFAVVVAVCVVVFIRSKKKALAFAQADTSEAFENTETFETPETSETETPEQAESSDTSEQSEPSETSDE